MQKIPPAHCILHINKRGWPNPGTSNPDMWRICETEVLEHNSISYWDKATVRSLKFLDRPRTLLQIILKDKRNRPPRARISLHIQKPKTLATVEDSINQTQQYNTKIMEAVAMVMLPPPPTKPLALPWQSNLSRVGKIKSSLSHLLKWEEWVTGRSSYDCGCISGSPLREHVDFFFEELILLWKSIFPEQQMLSCPNSYASQ